MLTATSKNSQIIYQSAISTFKMTAFAEDDIIAIDDVDSVKTTLGADGYMSSAVVAAKITGSFTFLPQSPTLQKIDQLQSLIYLSGQPNYAILTVVFPSLLRCYNYADFQLLSAPKGTEGKAEAQPRIIKWSAQVPKGSILSQAVQTILNLL